MSDIFQEVDDDVRKDKANKLWSKYGGYVIGICVAIVLMTGGRVAWQDYQASQKVEESTRYVAAVELIAAGKHKEAIDSMAALANEAVTGYGVLARLRQAQALSAAGDATGAVAIFDALAKSGDGGSAITGLAQISAIMQLFDKGSASDITARLKPLASGQNPWRFTALELQALLSHREGKIDQARKQFNELIAIAGVPRGIQQRAQQMLTILGEDPNAKKTPKQSSTTKSKNQKSN